MFGGRGKQQPAGALAFRPQAALALILAVGEERWEWFERAIRAPMPVYASALAAMLFCPRNLRRTGCSDSLHLLPVPSGRWLADSVPSIVVNKSPRKLQDPMRRSYKYPVPTSIEEQLMGRLNSCLFLPFWGLDHLSLRLRLPHHCVTSVGNCARCHSNLLYPAAWPIHSTVKGGACTVREVALLLRLARSQIHGERSQGNPSLSLAMLQVETFAGSVGAQSPVGIRRHRRTFEADCLSVGFADVPRFTAVVGLEEFIADRRRFPAP